MDLLEMVNSCSEEQLDSIIDNALSQAIASSDKKEVLGFGENTSVVASHKGLIAPDTRIRYCGMSMNHYSMKTTDYYYEFARYLKKSGVKSKGHLIKVVENFINSYFGIVTSPQDMRDTYFDQLAWQTTTTDDEYFAKLDSLQIGDLKGKNIAMCTERAAVAQNLLTLYGVESYYCMGCVDNAGKEEPHCFNIARARDSFMLLDYSVPCPVVANGKVVDYAPFQGKIELDEVEGILVNGVNKDFDSYEYVHTAEGLKRVPTGDTRTYIVGSFSFENKQRHTL